MESYPTNRTVEPSCTFPSKVAVVIPAWQPPEELVELVHSLQHRGCNAILVVDDGSCSDCQPVFQQIRGLPEVTVIRHEHNGGKGRALKTGIAHFLSDLPQFSGVVTADADGQHAADDIARVASTLTQQPKSLILGCRQPDPQMPLRSWFGNWLTRYVFRAVGGVMLTDTQTGLRAFPRELARELLSIDGERYEYEIAVLLHCCRSGRLPVEVPIRTIYREGNRSSHFRPVRDSFHIYRVIMGYCFPRPVGIARLVKSLSAGPRQPS